MDWPATVNDRRPKTRCMPGTTYFPSDAERREERSLTELQGVTVEDKWEGK